MDSNMLYYGDNLDVLRRHVKDESVDLVYLDPPFNSNANYNVLFAEHAGIRSAAQMKAFEDTWRWDQAAANAYQEVVEAGGKVSQVMQAFQTLLGYSDMLAYLAMMAPRLVELQRVLKPSGSIFLHCDPTASHYLKLLLDAVFGQTNFRNELVWHYQRWPAKQRNFQRMHDVILFYSMVYRRNTFNILLEPLSPGTLKRWRGKKSRVEFEGNVRLVTQMTEEDSLGRPVDDVWDMPVINSQAKERLGYPTQKPQALLERIITASSNPGGLVLDPFCGCGTTIAAAQRTGRRWIGIDITHLAIGLMKHRLRDAFGDQVNYQVIGEPVSLPDAENLAASDPYQFQWWALGLVGARHVDQKKGADKGIDGRIYFHDEAEGAKTKQVVLSVKAGQNIGVSMVRDLGHVVTRENAEIGVLITMQEPTQPMKTEAAGSGFYHSPGWDQNYPRLQILTIAQLLDGRNVEMPPLKHVNQTFKKAPKAMEKAGTLPMVLE